MRKQVSDGTPSTTHISPTRTSTIWIVPHMDLDKSLKPNDGTKDASRDGTSWINNTQHKNKVITQSHNTTLLHTTCSATSSAKQRVLTNCGSHGIFGSVLTWLANFYNNGQSTIATHQLQTSSSTDIPTPRALQCSTKSFHIFETTLRTLIKLDMELHTRSYSSTSWLDRSPTKTQIVLVQIQQPSSTTHTWLESTAQRSTWNTESIHKNRSNNKIGNTSMNKQQCCLVQRVRMHGNLGATQLLRNTLWSRTTNEDSTSLRGTHASLNDTHGGKKTPCNTAWRTAYAVTLCAAHLRCRRDKHRRIEHATRHPVLPRKSMHSLDVTHTNITFTRSSQTTDLSTNVNTTNTDSFTHTTTNKTNKNPIRHFHTKHDKLKPSHERTTSRARLSGSKNGTDSPRKQQILTRTGQQTPSRSIHEAKIRRSTHRS